MQCCARSVLCRAPATLLIPERLVELLDRALDGSSLDEVISRFVTSGVVPTGFQPGALRIRYQLEGLSLVRRDFRIDKAIWFQLGQMARTYGVSRCLLFVALLETLDGEVTEFRQKVLAAKWLLTEILDAVRYERVTRWLHRTPRPP